MDNTHKVFSGGDDDDYVSRDLSLVEMTEKALFKPALMDQKQAVQIVRFSDIEDEASVTFTTPIIQEEVITQTRQPRQPRQTNSVDFISSMDECTYWCNENDRSQRIPESSTRIFVRSKASRVLYLPSFQKVGHTISIWNVCPNITHSVRVGNEQIETFLDAAPVTEVRVLPRKVVYFVVVDSGQWAWFH